MTPTQRFIYNVKEFAHANRLKISKLEKHAGVSRGYLSKHEQSKGPSSIPLDVAEDIAWQIGVPIDTLLKEED